MLLVKFYVLVSLKSGDKDSHLLRHSNCSFEIVYGFMLCSRDNNLCLRIKTLPNPPKEGEKRNFNSRSFTLK